MINRNYGFKVPYKNFIFIKTQPRSQLWTLCPQIEMLII